jgi:tetratricopeptide (TPR) repeat protein
MVRPAGLAFDLAGLEGLLGDFVLEDEIAKGPRSAVFRVRTAGRGGRPLALKVGLRPLGAEGQARFRNQAQRLAEARHPNVAEVFDFGVLPGRFPYLSMELLSGASLADRLRPAGWTAFYDAAIQAAVGLAHLHRGGVVHLDLRPEHLGLAVDGDAMGGGEGALLLRIFGFGLGGEPRASAEDEGPAGRLAYAAPEVLLQDACDHRADLYSLGLTLFELATGVLPSDGGDRDPLALRPDMPPALARILTILLSRDPADRYASASRLLLDLSLAAERSYEPSWFVFPPGQVSSSRLVGREETVERLRGALAAAASGQGGAVLLAGCEGAGKSRLLRELGRFAAGEGARVGRGAGRCDAPQPLGPFLEALGELGIELSAAARPEGSWSEGSGGGTAHRARFRLERQIALALGTAAESGPPLLLLIDDLHLAGRESAELLAYLGEELRTLRVLVVAARLPEGDGEPGLDEARPWTHLELPPLDRAGTRRLIEGCLASADLAAGFHDWVHERSRGVPGEAERLLRHLVADGVLPCREGDWKPSLPALARWSSAPGGRAEQDWQRILTLPREARAVLDAAAVIAAPCPFELLSSLLGGDPQALFETLGTLVSQGHLERRQEPAGALYLPSTPALRTALYNHLTGERRAQLHRRVAEILADPSAGGVGRLEAPGSRGPAAAVIAEHFWRAGAGGAGGALDRARSLPYLEIAAAEALAVHGHARAAALFGRIAEASPDGQTAAHALASQADALAGSGDHAGALRAVQELLRRPDLERGSRGGRAFAAGLLLRKGLLHRRLGQPGPALESHQEGLRLAAGLGESALEVDLLRGKALAQRDLGDWEGARTGARSALALAGREGMERRRAELLDILGSLDADRSHDRRAARLIRRALRAAERCGDEDLGLTLRDHLGDVLARAGAGEQALALYRQNLDRCERAHDPWGELLALAKLGRLEGGRGDWLPAREPLARAVEVARRLGAREQEAQALLSLGEAEEVLGRWPRAERCYETAMTLLGDLPGHPGRCAALAQYASLDRKRGRSAEAERRARQGLERAHELGDRDLLARCCYQLGLIEKDRDNLDGAGGLLRQALALWEAAGARRALASALISLADLCLRDGELAEASRHAGEARRQVTELGDRFTLAKLLSVEARLASARDDVESAERLFAEGVRLLEALETPYEHARSLYEWGLRTWNVDTALRRLRRALTGFERLGAETESRRASGALERIREHQRRYAELSTTPPPDTAPPLKLSAGGYEEALSRCDRELIAAGLAQSGGKIRETARLLGIARNTLRAKMKKYGLQSSGE